MEGDPEVIERVALEDKNFKVTMMNMLNLKKNKQTNEWTKRQWE